LGNNCKRRATRQRLANSKRGSIISSSDDAGEEDGHLPQGSWVHAGQALEHSGSEGRLDCVNVLLNGTARDLRRGEAAQFKSETANYLRFASICAGGATAVKHAHQQTDDKERKEQGEADGDKEGCTSMILSSWFIVEVP
jgi:hypothetical protein